MEARHYTVLYTKDVHKKAKVWQDGVLTHIGKRLTLNDMEGKKLTQTNWNQLSSALALDTGAEMVGILAGKLVEIVAVVPESEITSGRVYLGTSAPDPATRVSQEFQQPSQPLKAFKSVRTGAPARAAVRTTPIHDPDKADALVLARAGVSVPVVVDPYLCKDLREHQKVGVQFLYDCIMSTGGRHSTGCIMADEMGMGKTLQAIALLWTLLKQGPTGVPIARKAIVVCPASLVANW